MPLQSPHLHNVKQKLEGGHRNYEIKFSVFKSYDVTACKSSLNIIARRDVRSVRLNKEDVSSNFPLTFIKFKYGNLLISIHTNDKNIFLILSIKKYWTKIKLTRKTRKIT